MKLNLFVVSSPLQLLTAMNIRLQYPPETDSKNILFIEGENYYQPLIRSYWDEVIVGDYVRPRVDNIVKNIRQNLKRIEALVKKYQADSVNLHISDLYWIANNIVYAYLKKCFKNQFYCSLFDEGCVLYTKQHLPLRERIRSFVKWCIFKFFGIDFQILHSGNFDQNNRHIKAIYCYHSELFHHARRTKAKDLNPQLLAPLLDQITQQGATENLRKGSLLFLSQTYFHHISYKHLRNVLKNLVMYFKKLHIEEFYFKPHHLDDPLWIDILQNEFHFKRYDHDLSVGIEASARYLNFEYIVAFSSSALLNLNKFGYRGTVVSYGINQFNQFKETRRINRNIQEIFSKKGISLIG